MKRYRVLYEVKDTREVWIETSVDEDKVEDVFLNDFTRYNDESDSYDGPTDGEVTIVDITEIDKDGYAI
jgi:hypothetical protein